MLFVFYFRISSHLHRHHDEDDHDEHEHDEDVHDEDGHDAGDHLSMLMEFFLTVISFSRASRVV